MVVISLRVVAMIFATIDIACGDAA